MEYVLAIGNSFSRDATAYLRDVCRSMGISAHVVNLYIGGCSLERHWSCVLNHEKAYQYQENGIITDRYVGVSDILHDKPWNYIVTQQASHDSGWADTYGSRHGPMRRTAAIPLLFGITAISGKCTKGPGTITARLPKNTACP